MSRAAIPAYPLQWPAGVPRHNRSREEGTFKGTLDLVQNELTDEVDRLLNGIASRDRRLDLVISTNMPLRRDGFINCSAPAPADPGVAIYFQRKGKDICLTCDRYNAVWKNLRALQRTIEAMRAIERYGSTDTLDRAFTGFQALPAPAAERHWTVVLGVTGSSSLEQIRCHYRELAHKFHPDKGGSAEAFAELSNAWEQAQRAKA